MLVAAGPYVTILHKNKFIHALQSLQPLYKYYDVAIRCVSRGEVRRSDGNLSTGISL